MYAILRHAKITATSKGAAIAHNHRAAGVDQVNIDTTLTPLNQSAFKGDASERIEALLPKKRRKDAVIAVEMVLGASPEFFDGIEKDRKKLLDNPKFRDWVARTAQWVKREFGRNLVDLVLHMDESTPHFHALAVPITKDGRLCAKEVMARSELQRRQTQYAEAMAGFGLERGESAEQTKRKHIRLKEAQGSGGMTSTLAADLAKARAEIAKLEAKVKRLQGFNLDYSAQIRALEAKLAIKEAELAKAKERESEATPAEAPNRALEAFLAEHKDLPRATPGEAAYGTLRASEGNWAVLHLGRGRLVLHEYPPGKVPELDRSVQRGGPAR